VNFSHVLISRPAAEADDIARRVRLLGLRPVCLPACRFQNLETRIEPPPGAAAAGGRLVIFTSRRAVEFGLPKLSGEWLDGARVAAMGHATREALQQAGVAVHLLPVERADSEGLLDNPDLPDTPGAALLVAAPGGRQALRRGLQLRGWLVDEALVYERVALEPDAAAQAELETAQEVISTWTSAFALQHLVDRMSPAARARMLDGLALVPSARLQALARLLGVRRVQLCAGADNASMEHGLRQALDLEAV
jgi:uroporphyrinogen-III synthase